VAVCAGLATHKCRGQKALGWGEACVRWERPAGSWEGRGLCSRTAPAPDPLHPSWSALSCDDL
jgi:hypothetical protein